MGYHLSLLCDKPLLTVPLSPSALLRLLEGCTVTLTVKPATNEAAGSPDIIAPSGDRKGRRAVRRGLDTGPMGGPGMTEKGESRLPRSILLC